MRDPIKIILGENEMAAVIDVFRVFEVGFRSGLLKAEVTLFRDLIQPLSYHQPKRSL